MSGEYVGCSLADRDPLEADSWLIPAHACTEKPPVCKVNEVAVWDNLKWTILPDFRGAIFDTNDGEVIQHKDIGELPAGTTNKVRPSDACTWDFGLQDWVFNPTKDAWLKQQELNNTSLTYLNQTDWYIVRWKDTGEEVPDGVREKREAARAAIVR